MIINSIAAGVSGIAADSVADDSKYAHRTNSAQSQAVQTTLSSDVASVDALVAKAMESPKPRQQRVEAMRLAISRGVYQPNPGEIASAMATHYST